MFPSFNKISAPIRPKGEDDAVVESLCPLGCICCIMQQFYNRRCWCKEVKESTSTQTDFAEIYQRSPFKVTVDIAIQTDELEIQNTPNFKTEHNKEQIKEAIKESIQNRPKRRRHAVYHFIKPKPTTDSENLQRQLKIEAENTMFSSTLEHALARASTVTTLAEEIKNYTSHGTVEHGKLQSAVNETMDKYDLTGAKDPRFEDAFLEVLSQFPLLQKSDQCKHMVRSKLRHRISSRRHYYRIKSEANAIGIAISTLKKQKVEENAIQHKLLGESIVRNSIGGDQKHTFPLLKLHNHQATSSPMDMTSLPDTSSLMSPPGTSEPSLRLPTKLASTETARYVEKTSDNSDSLSTVQNYASDFTDEALDLSDPRHDVIIKIEPLDS